MAKIDVYSSEMSDLSGRLKRIASVIEDAERITGKVQRNLDFQVAAKQGIASGLRTTRGKLQRQNDKVENLSKLTGISLEEFVNADNRMDRKGRSILGRIRNPVSGIVRDIKSFFVGISLSKYQKITSLFAPAGTIITVAGLGELIRRLREIIKGAKPGGGSGNSQTAGGGAAAGEVKPAAPAAKPVAPPAAEPVKKPSVVNTGSSKKNAENAGLTYYTQGKGYNKYWNGNAWIGSNGKNYDYKKSVACGICCDAMVAAYFGAKLTPGDLLQANGGDASWNGSGVKKAMAKHGITSQTVAKKSESPEAKVSKLDDCLEKYRSDPEHNAPPMISIYNKNNKDANHYVMVVGKDKNGDYIIVDPANDDRTTLKVKTEGYGKAAADKKGYESCIKNVIAFTKK